MKYYLLCNNNMMSIKCYFNDELIINKKIVAISQNLTEITSSHYELNEFVFGINCTIHIRKNSDFYFVHNNKKPIKISFKSFISTLKDIINGESERG